MSAVEKVDEPTTSAALICEVADVPTQDNDEGVLVRHTYQQCVRLRNSEMLNDLTSHLSHLLDCQRNDVETLIHGFSLLFQDVPSRTIVLQNDINVGHAVPIKQRAYRVKRSVMKAEDEYLRENGLAKQSFSPWSSLCLLVTKSDGSARFCTDYRKVNLVTAPDSFPLPRIEDCVDNLGSTKFVSKLDLLKGYWQVPLMARASDISAFVTTSCNIALWLSACTTHQLRSKGSLILWCFRGVLMPSECFADIKPF